MALEWQRPSRYEATYSSVSSFSLILNLFYFALLFAAL